MEKTLSLNHFSRRALLVTSLHCVFKAGVLVNIVHPCTLLTIEICS